MKNENKTPENLLRIMKITSKHKRNIEGIESEAVKSLIGQEISLAKKTPHRVKKYEVKPLKKLETSLSLRYDSGDLVAITRAKQLSSYIITITEKSPKKFRFSFVSKLHNCCLEMLEDLFKANATSLTSYESRARRKDFQLDAFAKMKLIGYLALLACENECILPKQFEHISMLVSDCVNLLFSWRKSDEKK